jgi:Cu(I)/Ag(I) efflux system protein CusF
MKSFVRSFAVLATLLFAAPLIHAHDGHLPQADGVIKKIEPAASRITIAHGPIANLEMPPMTMMFKAKDAAMLKPWKAGDKIRFRASEIKGVLTVVSIEAAK